MIVSASAMAFAHGSNDVANAIGPLAAIVSVVDTGEIGSKAAISPLGFICWCYWYSFGLATLGSRVIKTVGRKITALNT
jgi:PiT family inorganic phosphate transporter